MTAYAALLRGVNVGGRKLVPMGELRVELAALGFADVVTVLQSGNAVFRSDAEPGEIARAIEARIATAFRLEVAVLIRSAVELQRIAGAHPFGGDEREPSRLHVVFLDREPGREAIVRLDPERSPGDRFVLTGTELYVHYRNGAGRSKLTIDYVERMLGVRATARNWNTVRKLADLIVR